MPPKSFTLHNGDCLGVLKGMEDNSIDSVVCDPPYGLSAAKNSGKSSNGGFMGKEWDYDVPSVDIWKECLRVLKPGGHLLAFAGTRTQHRMAVNIEDAGFEIRDMIAWVYGSGFPKSLNLSKAIDKAAGARGHDSVGFNVAGKSSGLGVTQRPELRSDHPDYVKPQGITPEAQQWVGWGTALKPALEPITMARKPFKGTVAACVLEHGTGALNVDGCRVAGEPSPSVDRRAHAAPGVSIGVTGWETAARPASYNEQRPGELLGRWPANLIHSGDEEVISLFPQSKAGKDKGERGTGGIWRPSSGVPCGPQYNDSGSAARFFYCPKVSKKERGEGNNHPTVKPIALMAYLCRLVTPPGGTVLDPFMGSGSTGIAALQEGFDFIGIEREPEYLAIAESRISAAAALDT